MFIRKILFTFSFCFLSLHCPSSLFSALPWSASFQQELFQKATKKSAKLKNFPSLQYPNDLAEELLPLFPNQKVPIFGYGSLLNEASAKRSISREAWENITPSIAFGLKRSFSYRGRVTEIPLERAMLNVTYTNHYENLINGVVTEVGLEDLKSLVKRETGYDLVPILVASWQEAKKENPTIEVKIAYTFLTPYELREGAVRASYCFYPVRQYLQLTQEGAASFGQDFLNFWNETTYLGDGLTPILSWDKQTFKPLCPFPF